jgi:hypothetical protein
VRVALLILLSTLLALSFGRIPRLGLTRSGAPASPAAGGDVMVREGESIAAALERAAPGQNVIVEPGEYREPVMLVSHVRLTSRVPGGAILRLPASAGERDAAVIARGVTHASMVGFRIVGDASTALGTGLLIQDSDVSIVNTDISGATAAAIEVVGASRLELMASDVHDNPGAALAIGAGASARVTHNLFMKNGAAPHAAAPIVVGGRSDVHLSANIFHGVTPAAFQALSEAERAAIARNNWFSEPRPARPPAATRPRGGQASRPGSAGQP